MLPAQTPTLPLAAPAGGGLALGEDFVVGLSHDGIARSWGTNNRGQLGTAATLSTVQPIPTQLRLNSTTAMTGAARVYAGLQHGLLITNASTGVLRAWGRNDSGQLGDGSLVDRSGCVAVATSSGLTHVVAASAGFDHSLALKSDGTVWAWGSNASGQIGNNSTQSSATPIRVTPAAPVFPYSFQAVAAGHDHSLALRNDGTIWAWGANTHGQLGTGTTTASLVPVQVQNLPSALTVTAIAAGDGFSLALLSDGSVRTWGRADKGQLGHDSDLFSTTPVQPVDLGSGVTAIAAGVDHVLARKSDGSVWGWGSNFAGELGGLVPAAQFVPQIILGLTDAAVIDAGAARSGAVLTDGSVVLWGSPADANLGPASLGYRALRVQVRDVKTAAAIYAGGNDAAVVRTSKRAYLFGANADGQLGIGSLDPVAAPSRLSSWPDAWGANSPAYAFGAAHTLALVDGKVYAAGGNTFGQLGDGTLFASTVPTPIATPGAAIVRVSAGSHHSLALRGDGTVLAWGRNDSGQLGLGSSSSSPTLTPTVIPGLAGVVAVSAGESHSIALKSDGSVWTWGGGSFGQLGDNTTTTKSTPTQVKGVGGTGFLAGVTSIAAGSNHSLAANSATKRAFAWGRGTEGQVGHGSTAHRLTPFLLSNTNLVDVAAGKNHSLALGGDGRVVAWGLNDRGQVGDGTTTNRTAPVAVTNVTSTAACVAIAAGAHTSYAIFGNGSLFGWGDSSRLQLGYAPSRFTFIAWRLTNNSSDADSDGMLNTWETARFGVLTKTGYEDTDSDGLLDIQEHFYASLPANYPTGTVGADSDGDLLNDFADSDRVSPHNGNSYTLSVPAGNAQFVAAGISAPLAVTVKATLINGASVGAVLPVRLAASQPGVLISVTSPVPVESGSTLALATTSDGTATFYYRQSSPAASSIISFQIGAEIGEVYVFPPPPAGQSEAQVDSDADGLGDFWEIARFGSLRAQDGNANPDDDPYDNRTEQLLGTDPLQAAAVSTASSLSLLIYSPN